MKKSKVLFTAFLTFCIIFTLNISAYAETPTTRTAEHGWNEGSNYVFYIEGENRVIPHGTVCSRTYNANATYYVYTLQYILNDFGDYFDNTNYSPGSLDGSFGPNTERAVKYYQGRKALVVDGCVGDNTWQSFIDKWVFGFASDE